MESLQAYSTPGKLKNFRYSVEEVNSHRKGLSSLKEVETLRGIVNQIGPLSSYLSTAEAVLPPENAWVVKVTKVRDSVLTQIRDPEKRKTAPFRQQVSNKLAELKKDYMLDI